MLKNPSCGKLIMSLTTACLAMTSWFSTQFFFWLCARTGLRDGLVYLGVIEKFVRIS